MAERNGEVRIGVSGWRYADWRGHFYPEGLPQARELDHLAGRFRTVEVNGTFYRLQRPETFARWADAVPADFVFAVKGPRYVTHNLRLRGAETALANFFASGVLRLGRQLGPLLWQLPPTFRFEAERIEAFLERLPRRSSAAAELARRHDARLAGRAWTEADADRPLRYAIEVRHESFRDPAFVALLRRQRVALVCADTVAWPLLMDLTAGFVYCRLHGSQELYRSGYRPAELRRWAGRVAAWAEGEPMTDGTLAGRGQGARRKRDVYVYFDNTDKRRAPGDAAALATMVGTE